MAKNNFAFIFPCHYINHLALRLILQRKMKKILIITVLCFVLLLCGTQQAASAATRTVDTTADDLALTACTVAAPDDCSLRGAIVGATAGDTIDFALPINSIINLPLEDIGIDRSLSIIGPGADRLTIRSNGIVFATPAGANATVRISGLKIAQSTRAIVNNSGNTMFLSYMKFENNSAGSGVISNQNGTLEISNSIFTGSPFSPADLAAVIVVNNGTVTIKDSTITNNYGSGLTITGSVAVNVYRSTISHNTALNGGGIYASSNGSVNLFDTTVKNNTGNQFGGGIYAFGTRINLYKSVVYGNSSTNHNGGGIFCGACMLTLENSTVAANFALQDGGGLFVSNTGFKIITHSTIVNNTALGSGGGISTTGGLTQPRNSIIAGNSAPFGPDVFGAVLARYNLIGNTANTGFQNGSNFNILNQNPMLQPVDPETLVYLPQCGSPVLNAGDLNDILPFDGRGVPRPADERVDLGSIEQSRIALSPPLLPEGIIGLTYTQMLTATCSIAPYSFLIESGSLPNGLTLQSNGLISGTPTEAGTFDFTIRATASNNVSGLTSYKLTILNFGFITTGLPGAYQDAVYSQQLNVAGGAAPYSFSVESGNLPPGITLSPNGLFSGAPTQTGNFNFAVRVTDAGNLSVVKDFELAVGAFTFTPTSLPNAFHNNAYAQQITADGGTSPYSFSLDSGTLPAGMTLSSVGLLLGTPTQTGIFNFAVRATDANKVSVAKNYSLEVVTFTFAPANLPDAFHNNAYSQQITATGGVAPYGFTLDSGTLPAGMTISPAGLIAGTPTETGNFSFAVRATDANNISIAKNFVLAVVSFTFAPASLPSAYLNNAYAQQITASGGTAPYSFALDSSNLPPGMALSPNGLFSGTPTQTGIFNFTVKATDANSISSVKNYAFEVVTFTFAPAILPGVYQNSPYSQQISATGGTAPYSFAVSSGTLPGGVALSPAGLISGTPNQSGSFSFTVRATDANNKTALKNYFLNVGFYVMNTNDSGAGSLRQVVNDAPAGTPILFAPNVFSQPQTITLTGGGISINKNVIIDGTSANFPAVDGNNASRIFTVPPGITLSVLRVKIIRGNAGENGGGCISNKGIVNLVDSVISNCSAKNGGAIYNDAAGTVNLLRSIVSDNTSSENGGAIFNTDGCLLLVTDSTISNNTSITSNGGGVYDFGKMTAERSTFSGNKASNGGAILAAGAPTIVNNSTVSGNTATIGKGGAVYVFGNGRSFQTTNTTITDNLSESSQTGGVFVEDGVDYSTRNTIISGNRNQNGAGAQDVSGVINSFGYNLLGSTTGNSYIGNTTGNRIGAANLAPLANYGGATETHALLPNSQAIGAGDPNNSFNTDQRGSVRPIGGRADIGAFERNITLNPTTLPDGVHGVAYNKQFSATRATNLALASFTFFVVPAAGQSLPPGLTLAADGTLAGTPTQGGTFTFTVKATDADGISGAALYTILIESPPTVSDLADVSINEDTSTDIISFTVGDADTPASDLIVAATSSDTTLVPNNPANITLGGAGANRTIKITPPANQFGTATITVTVVNQYGSPATDQFVVTVAPINDAPSFTKGADIRINQDAGAQIFNNWATGINSGAPNESGQTLNFNVSITSVTRNLTFSSAPLINATTGNLTFTTAPGSSGTATVSITLSDNGSNTPPNVNASQAQAFVITVNSTAPTLDAIDDPAAILEDAGQQTINLSGISAGEDGESQTVTLTAVSNNPAIIPNPTVSYTNPNQTGELAFTPVADANGSAVITVTVTDSGTTNNSLSRTFTVNVTPVNDVPTFTKGAAPIINEDAGAWAINNWATNISAGASNESNQTLTFNVSITGTTGSLTFSAAPSINASNGTLTFTTAPNSNGTATVSVILSDNGSNTPPNINVSQPQIFTITVNPVNDIPTVSDIANRIVNQDASTGAISFTVGDVETSAADLILSVASSNQTLVPDSNISFGGADANRTATIAPAAGQSGTTTIIITVTDTDGAAASDNFILTVNAPPTISGIADQTTNEDTATSATSFTIGDAETLAANLTLSAVSSNPNLIPSGNFQFGGAGANRTVIVTPALNQTGDATITITVKDGNDSTAAASFILTVLPVNDNPTISAIGDQFMNADTSKTISFIVGDAETPADSLTVSGSSSNQALVADSSIQLGGAGANRTIRITPVAGQSGATNINITATDTDDNAFSRVFLLTVRPLTVLVTNGNNSGAGSLREAVDTVGDGGTINFAQEVTQITLTGGAIFLERSVTINGTGANHLTVSGNNNSRIFDTHYPGAPAVTISGLTLSNGRTDDYGDGGAVRNFAAGVMNIVNCTVSNNIADYGGGGIVNHYGTMNITGSTVSGNSSTFANGGGILHVEGQTNIINSTVSDNSAEGYQGGGVSSFAYFGTLTIVNSTISRNHASDGGGVYGDPVTLKNSIVALNTAASFPDIDGGVDSLDYNLIGSPDGVFITGATAHNIYNQNPRLAPLGNYGGATRTFALLPDSPAINAGDPNNVYNTDQRGVLRPAGGIDIGAFENSITFDQTSLPNGNTQRPYNFQLSATGQTNSAKTVKTGFRRSENFAPAQFSTVFVPGEQLPPGVSLSQSGQISGTPTTSGNYTFTVKATDSNGMAGVRQFAIQIFAPTAASVSVSGRVLTPTGSGLTNAMVMLTDTAGNTRIARTSSFGYYHFNDVAVGETYIFTVVSKRYQFAPQVVNVMEDLTELNFTAQQ
jgi:predicted outer membrane repeat protein